MATENYVSALKNHIASLDKVDMDRLARSSLGEESLSSELEPRLKKIHRLKELSLQYAQYVHDSAIQSMQAVFSALATQMTQQASRANPEFMAQKQAFLNGIDAQLEAAKQWEPFFIAGAIEARGFLEDEGIRKQHERTVSELKAEAQKTLDEVRNEAKRAIDEAKALADEIEQKARRTATKVSVKEAQEQFKEAQKDLERKVTGWGWWSIVAIGVFAGTAIVFIFLELPDTGTWQGLYYTALRIAILTAVAAGAGLCLKVLRAYMNMRERNLHRQRLANSIEAFVVSAQTPEARDFILAHLVEAVASFGSSGLLTREAEPMGSRNLPADTVLSLLSGRKSSP